MPKNADEKALRRVQVPLAREDHEALMGFAKLGLDEGKLIRAFWRIGLRHREEFFAEAPRDAATPAPPVAQTEEARSRIKAVK